MKTLFLTVATAALIIAAPTAFAQDDHHDHGGGHDAHAAAPAHTAAPAHDTHAAPPSHAAPSNTMMMSGATHGDHHHDMTTTNAAPAGGPPPGWTVKGHPAANNTAHGHDNAMHGNNAMTGNNNAMRGGNTHVTVNFNRRNVTASHHYHYRGGAYRGPSGYSYHRYSYGQVLPALFWAQNYWIDDYSDYGLAYPPPGCVWVRYGDDAILIDRFSGEILEVVYDQFD